MAETNAAPAAKRISTEGKTMADFDYFTRRPLETADGKVAGRAVVAVPKGTGTAQVEYSCPFCKVNDYLEMPFTRSSSKTFKFKCGQCKKTVRLPKLSKPAA